MTGKEVALDLMKLRLVPVAFWTQSLRKKMFVEPNQPELKQHQPEF